MRKLTYLAVFEPLEQGYSVYFPDLPGCASHGDSFDEALREAGDALALHIYGLEKDGDSIPEPSVSPALDPSTAAGYLIAPVSVFPDLVRNELDNRAVKTNLTIPSWLKEIAEEEGVNYSKLLQAALIDYLGLRKPLHRP